MDVIYSNVKFKKSGPRNTGDGETSREPGSSSVNDDTVHSDAHIGQSNQNNQKRATDEPGSSSVNDDTVHSDAHISQSNQNNQKRATDENEDVTYSTLRFTEPAGPSQSNLAAADSSPEPGPKVVTTGWAKGKWALIFLCAFFFAVAMTMVVLYILHSVSLQQNSETLRVKDSTIKQLQEKKENLSRDIKEMLLQHNDTLKNFSMFEKTLTEKEEIIKKLQEEKTNLTRDINDTQMSLQKKEQDYISVLQQNQQLQEMICDAVLKACCKHGWMYFRGKCYFYSTDDMTWIKSRDDCVTAGGDLLIINSKEEMDFITKSKPGYGKHFWIGLTDTVKEGDWRWLDGTKLSATLTRWMDKEPDDWKGHNSEHPEGEDCALIDIFSDRNYGFMDGFCDDQNRKVKRVCEALAQVEMKT